MSERRPFLSIFGLCFALVWGGVVYWLLYRSIDQRRLSQYAAAVENAGGYIPYTDIASPRQSRLDRFFADMYPRSGAAPRKDFDVIDLTRAKEVDALLSEIVAVPHLACVKLGPTLSDPNSLRHLAQLPALTDVVIDAPQADDRWFEILAECKSLRRISVRRGTVSDRSLERLSKLPALTIISIPDSAVTDAGIAHLASTGSLELLDIRGTATTDAAATSLAPLTKLRQVVIWRSSITPEGAARLQANHPERFIW